MQSLFVRQAVAQEKPEGFSVLCVKDSENDVQTKTSLESGGIEILEGESPSPGVLVRTGKSNPGQCREALSEGDVEAERPIDGLAGRNCISKAQLRRDKLMTVRKIGKSKFFIQVNQPCEESLSCVGAWHVNKESAMTL